MRNILVLPLSLLLTVACGVQEYKTTADGVIVNVRNPVADGPHKVRLQVMSDRIVRVSATPDKAFHDRTSLIVIPEAGTDVDFVVHNGDETVDLQTSALHVKVNKENGAVDFTDAAGNRITNEYRPASFKPIQVDGTHGYSTINRFDTDPDEGIYGLGQHQSDQWNYKGENEELFQYNTKISIPFVAV